MSIQIRLLTLILALVAIVAGTVRAEDERREGVAEGRIDGLLLLLKDKDVDVRRGAVSALGETGSIRAVPPLVAALDDDESSVRCAAVEALGKVGQPEVIAPLAALLRDDNDLASAAVAALGKVNSPQALAPLAWALHHGDNVMVMEAAGGLVKFGAAAVDTLVEALQGRAEVRDRAAEALTKIDDAKAAAAVATALGSPDWRIRLSMLGSIAGMETPPDGPWGDLLNPERERKEIRKAALKVLLRWDAPQSVKWLLLAAEDPEPQLRRQAVRALVSRGDKALIRPAMANALGNADVEVRQMAAEFFRSHLISADIPAVSTALINESDTDVLNWLIMALRDIKDKEAGDALAGFLERPGPQGLKESERRQFERALAAATDILAGNDDVRAVKGALRLLDASESHVIEKAIFSLVRLEGEEVFTLLIKAAEHKQLEVRQAAFQVMAERKPKDQRLV